MFLEKSAKFWILKLRIKKVETKYLNAKIVDEDGAKQPEILVCINPVHFLRKFFILARWSRYRTINGSKLNLVYLSTYLTVSTKLGK